MNLINFSFLIILVGSNVNSHPVDLDPVAQGFRDVATSDKSSEEINGKPDSEEIKSRFTRSANGDLQDFRNRILERLNEYRADHDLTQLIIDPQLERGAQEWAEGEARKFAIEHSCDSCPDYSEVLAKRRSTKQIPRGVEAGDWVYSGLFEDEERTYQILTDDPNIHTAGFGIAFSRDPADRSYHAYAVARFARG